MKILIEILCEMLTAIKKHEERIRKLENERNRRSKRISNKKQ